MTLRTFEIPLTDLRGLPGEDASVWADPVDPERARAVYSFLGEKVQLSLDGNLLRISIPEPTEHGRAKSQKDAAKAGDAARRGEQEASRTAA